MNDVSVTPVVRVTTDVVGSTTVVVGSGAAVAGGAWTTTVVAGPLEGGVVDGVDVPGFVGTGVVWGAGVAGTSRGSVSPPWRTTSAAPMTTMTAAAASAIQRRGCRSRGRRSSSGPGSGVDLGEVAVRVGVRLGDVLDRGAGAGGHPVELLVHHPTSSMRSVRARVLRAWDSDDLTVPSAMPSTSATSAIE